MLWLLTQQEELHLIGIAFKSFNSCTWDFYLMCHLPFPSIIVHVHSLSGGTSLNIILLRFLMTNQKLTYNILLRSLLYVYSKEGFSINCKWNIKYTVPRIHQWRRNGQRSVCSIWPTWTSLVFPGSGQPWATVGIVWQLPLLWMWPYQRS